MRPLILHFSGMGLVLGAIALTTLSGCAYPIRSTSLSPAPRASGSGAPGTVHRIRFVSAVIPPRQRSGLPWDDDNGKPDPYVRLLRGGQVVWKGKPEKDTTQPEFQTQMANNLELGPHEELRIELWDDDGLTSDPIGTYRHSGLPDHVVTGSETRILMEGKASISMAVDRPIGLRGLGISKYEVHESALEVVSLHRHSPAGRAGIVPGDQIVAINGREVEDLGQKASVSALSQAGMSQGELTLERGDKRLDVELDGGLTWVIR